MILNNLQLGQVFNEGIGSGGFAVVINGNTYIFDPWSVTPEVMEIKRKSALGVSLAKQGIVVDASATATVQVPFDNNENPLWLVAGATFVDPDGDNWWVLEAPIARRSGDTFKQEIKCTLRLN